MATFVFRPKQITQIREAYKQLNELGDTNIWLQPTHHGGCIQIILDKPVEQIKKEDYVNVYCKTRTGYQKLCNDTVHLQSSFQLKEDWINTLLQPNGCHITFHVNVKRKTILQVQLKVQIKS